MQPLLFNNKEVILFREFEKKAINLAYHLGKKGIKEGDNAAVISENNPDFILLIFSLWKLKAVPVPLNIKLLTEEIGD